MPVGRSSVLRKVREMAERKRLGIKKKSKSDEEIEYMKHYNLKNIEDKEIWEVS
jgi:hypothetical protein